MLTALKGFNDVRPGAQESFLDSRIWQHIFDVTQKVFAQHNYAPVWLPLAEQTALFARGIGEHTDIVSKEMYSFTDRGERAMTLRPEGTAGAVRAYVQYHLAQQEAVQRWYYIGPMFRAERPQKGRYRQFYQIGAEHLGVADVAADVDLMLLLEDFCGALGLPPVQMRINSLGDAQSRTAYRAVLSQYLQGRVAELCPSCQTRLQHNPLRVLDCKRPSCADVVAHAPDVADSLSPVAKTELQRAQQLLDAAGLNYHRDRQLVRGLDYYTGLIFEVVPAPSPADQQGALGAQNALMGGGRYDTLVADLGGVATPALGFAAGVERLALLLAASPPPALKAAHGADLFISVMGEAGCSRAWQLARQLRSDAGLRVEVDVSQASLKQQLRRADRQQARFALVLGEQELQEGQAKLKDLREGGSRALPLQAAALSAALRAEA